MNAEIRIPRLYAGWAWALNTRTFSIRGIGLHTRRSGAVRQARRVASRLGLSTPSGKVPHEVWE